MLFEKQTTKQIVILRNITSKKIILFLQNGSQK